MSGFSTKGNTILSPDGSIASFNGISWFGFETGNYAPHGIWQRKMDDMLDQIKSLGFTLIRLPFCNQMFDSGSTPTGIDFNLNPDLQGKTPLQLLDVFIQKCQQRDLLIFLDHHRTVHDQVQDLWYDAVYTQDRWISDWLMLANRYRGNASVIGAELHNEPHGQATWKQWADAAMMCGNKIVEVNPDWLILVQGVQSYNNDFYWWGGNLEGVKDHPVKLNLANKLVYTAHDYGAGVSDQSWFHDTIFPKNLPTIWNKYWEYIHEQQIAPVMITEFGGKNVDMTSNEGQWQNALVDYIKEKNLYWSYWCLNPNSGDTGGILKDDWITVNVDKITMLSRIMHETTQTPPPDPNPQPIPTPIPTTIPPTPSSPPIITPPNSSNSTLSPFELTLVILGSVIFGAFLFGAITEYQSLQDEHVASPISPIYTPTTTPLPLTVTPTLSFSPTKNPMVKTIMEPNFSISATPSSKMK